MDDLRKKLIVFGGIIGFLVVAYVGYTFYNGGTEDDDIDPDPTDLPITEMIDWYKNNVEYGFDSGSGVEQASFYFYSFSHAIIHDTTSIHKSAWVNKLLGEYASKLSQEIQRHCRYDDYNYRYYESLRDTSKVVLKKLENRSDMESITKGLDTMAYTLYLSVLGHKIADKTSKIANNEFFSNVQYDKYMARAEKIEARAFLNQNAHVMQQTPLAKNILNQWKRDYNYISKLKPEHDPLGVIRFNCSSVKTELYVQKCKEEKEHAFNSYIRRANTVDPSLEQAEWVIGELDCYPLKSISKEYYDRCRQTKINYEKQFRQ